MGLSVSTIAVKASDDAALLERLGLVDLGTIETAKPGPLFWTRLPDDWIVIISTDIDYVSADMLAVASAGTEAIRCVLEEHVMISEACAYRDGNEVWAVKHDSQLGLMDLQVTGEPPPQLQPIRAQMEADQAGDDRADLIFEIPIELAKTFTGFRPDEGEHECRFLEPVGGWPKKRGLLGRLFGGR